MNLLSLQRRFFPLSVHVEHIFPAFLQEITPWEHSHTHNYHYSFSIHGRQRTWKSFHLSAGKERNNVLRYNDVVEKEYCIKCSQQQYLWCTMIRIIYYCYFFGVLNYLFSYCYYYCSNFYIIIVIFNIIIIAIIITITIIQLSSPFSSRTKQT